jgi:hypothetical protein
MLKAHLSRAVPLRDFRSALVIATVWMLVFGLVTHHPVEEWAVAISVLYASLWFSNMIVIWLIGMLLQSIIRYGRSVLSDAVGNGTEIDQPAKNQSKWVTIVLILFIAAILFMIVGLSISVSSPLLQLAEFAPLAFSINLTGWILFGIGMLGTSMLMGSMFLIIGRLDYYIRTYEGNLTRLDQLPYAFEGSGVSSWVRRML